MPTWQDQKALDDEQQLGARLARRWLELHIQMLALTHDARHEFDRVLKHVAWVADSEIANSPLTDDRENTMGGPEPGVMPDHEEN